MSKLNTIYNPLTHLVEMLPSVDLEKGTWRRRSNLELYRSYKESDNVNFIKIQQIKWAGHVIRRNEDRTTKKVFNAQPIGTRRKGRPNLRWIDGLEKDLPVLRTRTWRTLEGRRLAWKRLLEKAKAHPGLSTATAGSDVVQSGRPIFDDFSQHLWPYVGNNTANVVFQMVKRLWLIRIDQ
ncbi:uncharacterized protein TNCV_188941 [Trichonephila clavipes]|nr:uncharacterized protein TNCV_188941 [Trichonephila clavipes]